MDGMTNGLDMTSSSGSHPFYLIIPDCLRRRIDYCETNPSEICRYMALLVVSLVCYVATLSFSGLLFYLFTPSGHDCGLNTFFIVMTLISVFVFAIVTLHPSVSI